MYSVALAIKILLAHLRLFYCHFKWKWTSVCCSPVEWVSGWDASQVTATSLLTYVSKHIRPQPKCAIGFCRMLVMPGDPISSCSPSSLSPLSSSMFLTVCLSFYHHQGSTWWQLIIVLLMVCATHDQSSDNNNNNATSCSPTIIIHIHWCFSNILNDWEERSTLRVKFLAQDHRQYYHNFANIFNNFIQFFADSLYLTYHAALLSSWKKGQSISL